VDGGAARPVLRGAAQSLGERRHPGPGRGKSLARLLLHRPGLRLLLHRLLLVLRHRRVGRLPGLLLHRLLGCLPALRLLLGCLARLLVLECLSRLGLLRGQELLGRRRL
jgi:hypothetical protein